jgi:heterodisulfide reductase subunit A
MDDIKIGVYVCHCGLNIARTVDVQDVANYAGSLPRVKVARDYRYLCSNPGQDLIKTDIKELGLNRVVIASCSPRLHEVTFRNVCQSAGLNPYLYEQANIREQCSWVHENRELATRKAKELVKAAVKRVYFQEPLQVKEAPVNPNVLIVGSGIAGMQAALDIAGGGKKVYLVEKDPAIGGHMAQLDRTFPTLDCSECILTPKMTDVGHHPFIELMTYSEVEEVTGSIGDFKVKVRRKARYVDEAKCVGCGLCEEKCPWKTDSEYEMGLVKRKAAYIPFPQAVPHVATIDKNICVYIKSGGKKCGACLKFCDAKAIDFNQTDRIVELNVGSIIVATGYDQFNPSVIPRYGYGKYDNVITGLEFERMTCAAGPTAGKIFLKNGTVPQSVAIVHCVGSRDKNFHEYCSRVCCTYALKYGQAAKELAKADIFSFYIDMRCYGEGFEEYYERVSEIGVNFIRGKVGRITDQAVSDEEKGKLIVVAEDTLLGKIIRVPVDMVILCAAIEPRHDADKVAQIFSINRREDGFFMERHVKLDPVATATDGIFIAGCCEAPRDIPDSVAQASAAAGKVLSLISKGSVTLGSAIAQVDETKCQGCGRCEEYCTSQASKVINKNGVLVCSVNEALCRGCGICAVVCPAGAKSIKHFTKQEILAQVSALTEENRVRV